MKHGTIQAISGEENALAGFLISIFNENPDAFKVKSVLSNALEDIVALVVGEHLPYEKIINAINVFQNNGDKSPEIKKLSVYLQENITDFIDFTHKKPLNFIRPPNSAGAKRLSLNTANTNIVQ